LFVPYQYAVCMCSIERMELILKLENEVTELFNNTINDLFEVSTIIQDLNNCKNNNILKIFLFINKFFLLYIYIYIYFFFFFF